MWIFYDPDSGDDPFQNLEVRRNILVQRLGLSHYEDKGILLVAWAHRIPRGKGVCVRYPTVFDANLEEQWRPGGRTLPLGENNTKNGLSEAVHNPILGEHIVKPIRFLEEQ